jgi:hypothetical protein
MQRHASTRNTCSGLETVHAIEIVKAHKADKLYEDIKIVNPDFVLASQPSPTNTSPTTSTTKPLFNLCALHHSTTSTPQRRLTRWLSRSRSTVKIFRKQ